MIKMAECLTELSPRCENTLKASARVVETGWYTPFSAHGAVLDIPRTRPAAPPPQREPLQTLPAPVPQYLPPVQAAVCEKPPEPAPVLPPEPLSPPAAAEPVPTAAESAAGTPESSPPPVPEQAGPTLVSPTAFSSGGENSLSRLLSSQGFAAVLLLGAGLLIRFFSEPLFLQVQEGLRETLADMQAVFAVAQPLWQEGGIQERLRELLTPGLEEDGRRLNQGQAEIIFSSPGGPDASSEDAEPAGGAENPSDPGEMTVSQAVAAGGTYPVSMEQIPYALSVMQDGRRSAAAAVLPVEGHLTCEYGPREHPITGKPDFHTGIDIGAPLGTPVYAAAAGFVEKTGKSNSLGNYLMVRHSASAVTTYSHCSRILAEEGEAVACGQTIAQVGSSGVSTGPHLHFECIVDGTLTDPAWVLELPLPTGRKE